jgi:hypothetical protein
MCLVEPPMARYSSPSLENIGHGPEKYSAGPATKCRAGAGYSVLPSPA